MRCPPAALLLPLLIAAAPPKFPRDAPYCAAAGAVPLFVSPMGEPFRGRRGEPWPSAAWFRAADRDGSGTLDPAEFVLDARRFFRLLDRDGDGRLTPEEIERYEREVAPEIALYQERRDRRLERPRSRRSGESDYGGPLGAGIYSWLNIPEPVIPADADMDRIISAAEFDAAAERRFALLDKDGNGRLALASLGPTPQQAEIEGPCHPRPKPKRDDRARDALDSAMQAGPPR